MKLSKHLHSCLLVEEKNTVALLDPGVFTYQEKALPTDSLTQLDYILITHEHPDHMYLPWIKELVEKFSQVTLITTPSAVQLLTDEGITAQSTGDTQVSLEPVPHAPLWDTKAPENVLINVFDRLTSPGDFHHFATTKEILALPIQAPWGSTIDAIELALRLKPNVIIPIHDWMWKDGFRQTMYQRLEGFFKDKDINFKPLETGEMVEA